MSTTNHYDDDVKAFLDQGTWAPNTPWRDLVTDLTAYLVQGGLCFSSGEIARWLRINRPAEVFAVGSVGEHVRDLFYGGAFGTYTMVPRTTQGLGRTPAGVEVFVYAPDDQDGWGHEFEVDIPRPGGAATTYPDLSANMPPNFPAPSPSKPAVVALKASVQKDARLQVPRAAFEAFVHFCNTPMRGGDPVWVKVENDKAVITITDPGNGAKQYDLWADSGRVSFPSQTAPFTPGDVYLVNIAPAGLTVDLTQKV
jgi:hypothetical protein